MKGGEEMNKYINFDKMITPTIIKILFWVGVGLSVISGLIMIVSGISSPWGGGMQVIMGLLTIVIGPLVSRIYCELLIVMFKMQESLVDIKGLLEKQSNNQ